MKRIFLIVLDSVGIGAMPDAAEYGDAGSHTLLAASKSSYFSMPNMRKLGFFNIDGVSVGERETAPRGSYARLADIGRLPALYRMRLCLFIQEGFRKKLSESFKNGRDGACCATSRIPVRK